MSMFDNKTKPELEQGCYIAYADEPNTIAGSGGGGGMVFLDLDFDALETPPYTPTFTYNDVKNNLVAGKFVCLRAVYTVSGVVPGDDKPYDVVEVFPVYMIDDNREDAYDVMTTDYRFTATDPDEIMTVYSE